jgi:hypothetical protein
MKTFQYAQQPWEAITMNKYYTIYQLIVLFCIGLLGPLHLPWVANAQAGIIREFQGGFVTFLAKKAGTGPGTKTTNMDVGEKSIPPRDEYWLDYWMKWSPGWIDGEGGKLPGLAGGTGTTGCLPINPEGWSARFMWDPMRLYIYHQNRIKACGDGPKLDIKPDLNEALKVDKWFRITERVKVNTPNEPNGVVQVWINGKQVFSKRDWRLRGDVDASTALVDRFLISVFRGGKDESWAVDVDTTVEFKPFYILDCQPVFTGDENSRPICSGSISDEQDKAACIPAGNEFRVESVRASGDDGHVPTNTCDNDLNTRWSAEGDGQWIEFDLGAEQFIDKLAIAFFKGDQRKTFFDFQLSNNATDWSTISSPQSSGNTPPGEKETFDLNPNTFARYVRLFGHGNSGSDSERGWNSITDVNIFPAPPPPRGSELAINTVSASSDDGHIPMNTLDNDLTTRWSAEGQSEWIEFDLGAVKFIGKLAIAFYPELFISLKNRLETGPFGAKRSPITATSQLVPLRK